MASHRSLALALAALGFAPWWRAPSQEPPGAEAPPPADAEEPGGRERFSDDFEEEIDPAVVAEDYFQACDHDRNGWISYREASASLALDRDAYAVYDTDRDGRITFEEFYERYRTTLARAGGFREPRELAEERLVPSRSPDQLRNAYDRDGDGALDVYEVTALLEDYERRGLPVELIVDRIDADRSGKLELGEELETFARLLSSTYEIGGPPADDEVETAGSVLELFGEVTERGTGFDAVPQPPRIVGPVPHFRRLDLDGDGFVSHEDLEVLQRPVQLPVRIQAVISALDTDEDGVLSPRELRASMDQVP